MNSQPLIEILESCIGCNKCVEVCPRYLFSIENKKAVITNFDPCHDCGHCLAICPVDAIIHHRMIMNTLEEDFPPVGKSLSYDQVLETIRQRRSIRLFTDKIVSDEDISKLIELGRYAPSGHNHCRVSYTVINGRKEVEHILENMIQLFKKMKKQLNSKIISFFAILAGKGKFFAQARRNLYRLESHIYHWEKGIDKVLHYSSTLILIHVDRTGSPIEDCNIAAQNIMLGAPTLGLGATYIGYLLKSWENSEKIREIIGLPDGHTLYACLAIGYPKNKFRRLVPRPESRVTVRG